MIYVFLYEIPMPLHLLGGFIRNDSVSSLIGKFCSQLFHTMVYGIKFFISWFQGITVVGYYRYEWLTFWTEPFGTLISSIWDLCCLGLAEPYTGAMKPMFTIVTFYHQLVSCCFFAACCILILGFWWHFSALMLDEFSWKESLILLAKVFQYFFAKEN